MRCFSLIIILSLVNLCGKAASLVGNVDIKVEGNAARVHWVTDVATGTKVQVKPDLKSIEIIDSKTISTNHEVLLHGLQTGVDYQILNGTARVWLDTNHLSISVPPGAKSSPQIQTAAPPKTVVRDKDKAPLKAPPTKSTWANVASLPDHFARHGGDFHATDQDDYARMAWEFLQRAKSEGLPCKVDEEGVLRIYDARSGTFASYNRDEKTKTFFKPGSRDYFERQPGRLINLRIQK